MNGSKREDRMPQKIHKASMLLGKAAKVASKGGNLAREKGKAKALATRHHKAKDVGPHIKIIIGSM